MAKALFETNAYGDTWVEPELDTRDGRSVDQLEPGRYRMDPVVSAELAVLEDFVEVHTHRPAGVVMATVFGLRRTATCVCGAPIYRCPPGPWQVA